jgi:predicted component of type VI protein secretion system
MTTLTHTLAEMQMLRYFEMRTEPPQPVAVEVAKVAVGPEAPMVMQVQLRELRKTQQLVSPTPEVEVAE